MIRLGAAALFTVLVAGYGALSWWSTEDRVLAAAEAEGRATLHAVASGVSNGLAAADALEERLEARLVELSRELATELAEAPGREADQLARFARRHRLRGALWLHEDLTPRATSDGGRHLPRTDATPFSRERVAPLEARTLAARLRKRGLGPETPVVLGFDDPPYGDRQEFLVAARVDPTPGYLVLRQDVEPLRRFQERAGVERLLAEAAQADAVAYLALEDAERVVVIASDAELVGRRLPAPQETRGWRETTAGTRVLDVVLPADAAGGTRLRAGLASAPVESLITGQRLEIGGLTLLVLFTGIGGLTYLTRRESVARRRETELQRRLEGRERLATLGRLAGGVAHEVRGPLNALSMAAQRLGRAVRDLPPERVERVGPLIDAVRDEVGRMEELVRDFLVLGQDAPALDIRPLELGELLPALLEREAPGGSCHPPTTAVELHADRAALERAVGNLLRNAAQLAPPESVELAWEQAGDGVRIEVRDRGPGLTPEQRERVFEPFWSERAGGTGLGLTLAREAVERHGGRLEVRPREGTGTVFAVVLPRRPPSEPSI